MDENIFISRATIPLTFPTAPNRERVVFSEECVRNPMRYAKGKPVLGNNRTPIGFVDSEREITYDILDDRIICNVPVIFINTSVSMSQAITKSESSDTVRVIGFDLGSIQLDK